MALDGKLGRLDGLKLVPGLFIFLGYCYFLIHMALGHVDELDVKIETGTMHSRLPLMLFFCLIFWFKAILIRP